MDAMGAATAAASATDSPAIARARATAKKFEAMALGELLEPVVDSVDMSQGPFGGGGAEALWRPLLTQEIAKKIADAGGFGIADTVLRQMLQMQEEH